MTAPSITALTGTMQVLMRPWGAMHCRIDGPEGGPTVIFANSLGTDLRVWDGLLPHLPAHLRLVRYDKRGHGLSDPGGHSTIEEYADDAIALIKATASGPVIFVGLSIGGLIAQAVASAAPELIRALVLSNTAARLGTKDGWQARINAVNDHGLPHIADSIMERWFAPAFRATPALALWRNMLIRTPARGYTAACVALAGADRTNATRALRMPTLVIAGAEDGSAPPDVVRGLADLIPGAAFHLIPGAGHLPCVEVPAAFAAILIPFIEAQT